MVHMRNNMAVTLRWERARNLSVSLLLVLRSAKSCSIHHDHSEVLNRFHRTETSVQTVVDIIVFVFFPTHETALELGLQLVTHVEVRSRRDHGFDNNEGRRQ